MKLANRNAVDKFQRISERIVDDSKIANQSSRVDTIFEGVNVFWFKKLKIRRSVGRIHVGVGCRSRGCRWRARDVGTRLVL